ncbi:MAG: DUF1292 domain-containing protein [Firmicutes bacterium]|nr:DUF1292 domain-containing protein [Bacillota bacterium]
MAKNPDNRPLEDEAEEPVLLELTDSNGNEVQYELLDVVSYQEKDYIIVVPYVAGDDSPIEQVEIYRVEPDEDQDTETYVGLETQAEVDAVFELFRKRSEEFFDFVE